MAKGCIKTAEAFQTLAVILGSLGIDVLKVGAEERWRPLAAVCATRHTCFVLIFNQLGCPFKA